MYKLILGDNLEILKMLECGSVDLIYLAPPSFSICIDEVIRKTSKLKPLIPGEDQMIMQCSSAH